MSAPLLLDQLSAQHRSQLLADACWHRAVNRARPAAPSPLSARLRPLLSRFAARAGAATTLCCA